jgi:hypothetical protein
MWAATRSCSGKECPQSEQQVPLSCICWFRRKRCSVRVAPNAHLSLGTLYVKYKIRDQETYDRAYDYIREYY